MFWEFNKISLDDTALIDSDNSKTISYRELINKSEFIETKITDKKKQLIFLFSDNSYQSLISYIAILRSGNTCCLIDKKLSYELKAKLIEKYQPEIIISNYPEVFKNYNRFEFEGSIHFYSYFGEIVNESKLSPDLALLLSTSGSTGNPKLVRLSYKNLQSNAEAIAESLNINNGERPITSLPFSYSYGLSVINSHLLKGASIVLTNQSFVLKDFWNNFNEYGCTSFSGVPYSYSLLMKVNFSELNLPTLKSMTQAGGRLSDDLKGEFYNLALSKGFKFYVLYGQTEATARMTYLPFNSMKEKFGSIGLPVPGGKISILSENKEEVPQGEHGEIVYEGPNVMMGYAENREDLSKGDENMGMLFTGDLGKRDSDGYFYVTGRLNRFIKLRGIRFNLDDIVEKVESTYGAPNMCYGEDDNLFVLVKSGDVTLLPRIKNGLSKYYKIHNSMINVDLTSSLPYSNAGKPDYNKVIRSIK